MLRGGKSCLDCDESSMYNKRTEMLALMVRAGPWLCISARACLDQIHITSFAPSSAPFFPFPSVRSSCRFLCSPAIHFYSCHLRGSGVYIYSVWPVNVRDIQTDPLSRPTVF